jgi:vancomycin resistance protein YoaR
MKRIVNSFACWVMAHKRQILTTLGVLLVIIIAIQLIYPSKNLLPFARIDNLSVGGWEKKDAIYELDARLNKATIPVAVSGADSAYDTILPEDIGLNIDNETRVNGQSYPLWARLIPTSIVWYQLFQTVGKPRYERDKTEAASYIKDALGSCDLAPKNASLIFKGEQLEVVAAKDGGSCDSERVMSKLSSVKPTLVEPATIILDVDISKPKVDDDQAKQLKEKLEKEAGKEIEIKIADETQTIPSKAIFSWLTFKVKKDSLTFDIDMKKSNDYFAKTIAKKVTIPAGITKVETRDFTELSRVNGKNGLALNGDATRSSIKKVLEGAVDSAQARTVTLKPKIEYERSYTKTSVGISALVAQYGQDHSGTFGVAFRELGGQGRQANYNDTGKFITASTYKLFVAYGTLKKSKLENGSGVMISTVDGI